MDVHPLSSIVEPPTSQKVKTSLARRCLSILFDPRLYAWAGLVIAMACVFRAIPSKATHMWVSSDTLWPVDLFIDVFVDGFSFSGWRFSIAPCWAPDIIIVGICYLFVRNPLGATLIAGAVQFVILVAGFCFCWRALRIRQVVFIETLTIASAIAITLWIASHTDIIYPGFYQLLLPQTHVGNLIMQVYTLWLTALAVQELPDRRRALTIIGLVLICFLAGLSNLMYFPHTIAPISLAMAILVLVRAVPLRKAAVPVMIGWIATAAGAVTYRVLFHAMGIMDQSKIGYDAWRTAMQTFGSGLCTMFGRNDFQHIVAALWLMGCTAIAGVLLWRLRSSPSTDRDTRVPTVVFLVAAAAASVLGPITLIAGGSNGLTELNNYVWTMHYLHPTFLLPLFAWPIVMGFLPKFRLIRPVAHAVATLTAAAMIGVPAAAFARTPKPSVSIYDYRPEYVRSLDGQAPKYGIKYGLAGYWQARVITLLSRTKMRVYPIGGLLTPFLVVSNIEWYHKAVEDKTQNPCFSFVVLDDPLWKIPRANVINRAGEPTYDVNVGGVPVMIYLNGTSSNTAPRCVLGFD